MDPTNCPNTYREFFEKTIGSASPSSPAWRTSGARKICPRGLFSLLKVYRFAVVVVLDVVMVVDVLLVAEGGQCSRA